MKRPARTLLVLVALAATVSASSLVGVPTVAQAADGAPELIGHWTFDDDTLVDGADGSHGGDAVLDTSNCIPPTSSTDVPPSVGTGRSLSLDGRSCLVITNPFRATADHGVITNFTICSWINTTSQGTGRNHWNSAPILDGEVGGIANDFGFGLSETGKLTFGTGRANRTNDERIDGSTTVNDGKWHHVCVTRDATKSAGNVLLYVDGALEASTSSNGRGGSNQDAPTASPIAHIGWGQDDYHNKFVGLMDDMRTYDAVVDAAGIANLYAGSDDLQVSADGDAAGTGDGVPAAVENAAPNGGDANADGVRDSIERNVASLPNTVDGQYTSLVMAATGGACVLSSVTNGSAPADPGYAYLAGLTTYTAGCDSGSTASVTQYQYGETCNRLAVRSYDAVTGTYSTVAGATISQTTIDGTVVAVASFSLPGASPLTGTFGIAESTSACPVSPLNALPVITIAGVDAPDTTSDHTDTDTTWSLALGGTRAGGTPTFTWSISTPAAFGTATGSSATGAATTLTYVPRTGFVGTDRFTIQLADGAGGFDHLAVELAIGPQLANVTSPAISVSGGLYSGDTLSMSSTGSWNFSGTTGSGTRYQWYKVRGTTRTAINGATGAALVLTPDLIGADVVVEVTAWARFYAPASVSSDAVGPVMGRAFTTQGDPTISGTPRVGETMTADPDAADWAPAPESFSYQWFADGVAIGGALDRTFVIAPAQAGSVLTVAVTANRAGWVRENAVSDASARVAALPSPSVPVAVPPAVALPAALVSAGLDLPLLLPVGGALAVLAGALLLLGVRRRGDSTARDL